jgi:hypothetical protein
MTLIPDSQFRQKRAQQLCAFLMRHEGATRFSIAKCAALLYLAERQCYGEHGIPLTYDRILNTPDGPGLVKTITVLLTLESPNDSMSEFSTDEIESIECAFQVYSGDTEEELLNHLRKLKEWKCGPQLADSHYVTLETMLSTVGFNEEDIIPQIAKILDLQANAESKIPA